jgi:hypothetical protein
MFSIPNNLHERIRSFLPFRELHRSRSVCKSWRDISNIPKAIHEHANPGTIPPHASLTEVRILNVKCFFSNTDNINLMYNIFHQSQRKLKHLTIDDSYTLHLDKYFIPKLESLTYLNINSNPIFVHALVKQSPNLKTLVLGSETRAIDLAICPTIKYLTISDDGVSVMNFEHCDLQYISFQKVTDFDMIANWFTIPGLEIHCEFYMDAIEIFDIHSSSDELSLTWFTDFDFLRDSFDDAVDFLKETLKAIQTLRDAPISVDHENEGVVFLILHMLSQTKLLTKDKLFQIATNAMLD